MRKLHQWIDNINNAVGKGASYLVIVSALIVLFEVFMRYLFNKPTLWALELTTFTYGAYFMLGAGYVYLLRKHVHIEIVEQRFSDRVRAILRIITFWVIFLPFVGSMFVRAIFYASKSWAMWEKAWTAWAPPLYPIKTVMPVAFLLLLLQGFSNFLKDVEMLKGAKR